MMAMRGLLFIICLQLASVSLAGAECVEHAVLRDVHYFTAQYRWSAARVEIKQWDSPSMIRQVGRLSPGDEVVVLERKSGFLKVRPVDEKSSPAGWIGAGMVEESYEKASAEGFDSCGSSPLASGEQEQTEDNPSPVISMKEHNTVRK